jgi:ABC-type Fe3+ transport system substrate-binding protein
MLIRQMMGFLKEDDEVAAQANLTYQSTQAATAIAQRAADGMHQRNAYMREIIKNLQKSQKRHHSHQTSAHVRKDLNQL